MSTLIKGNELREISLGRYVQGKTSDVTSGGPATYQMFTVAGGEVLITALWGKVTTAITTTSETLAIQLDPTAGTTKTIVTATDVGSTDTAVGDVIGFRDQGDATIDVLVNGFALRDLIVSTGEIEAVVATASSNGVIEWYCTWVPLTPGATVEASA